MSIKATRVSKSEVKATKDLDKCPGCGTSREGWQRTAWAMHIKRCQGNKLPVHSDSVSQDEFRAYMGLPPDADQYVPGDAFHTKEQLDWAYVNLTSRDCIELCLYNYAEQVIKELGSSQTRDQFGENVKGVAEDGTPITAKISGESVAQKIRREAREAVGVVPGWSNEGTKTKRMSCDVPNESVIGKSTEMRQDWVIARDEVLDVYPSSYRMYFPYKAKLGLFGYWINSGVAGNEFIGSGRTEEDAWLNAWEKFQELADEEESVSETEGEILEVNPNGARCPRCNEKDKLRRTSCEWVQDHGECEGYKFVQLQCESCLSFFFHKKWYGVDLLKAVEENKPPQVEYVGGLAASTKVPGFHLIPTVALEALAERFEKGIERKGNKSWNALSSNQSILTDREFAIERIAHIIHHCMKLRDKLIAGEHPFEGDDDAGAIIWGGAFLCSVKQAMKEQNE